MFTNQPLFGLEFIIFGETSIPRTDVEHKIRVMGGKISSKIHKNLAAIISKSEEAKVYKELQEAFSYQIRVIPDNFLYKSNNIESLKKDLSKWGLLVSFYLSIS